MWSFEKFYKTKKLSKLNSYGLGSSYGLSYVLVKDLNGLGSVLKVNLNTVISQSV